MPSKSIMPNYIQIPVKEKWVIYLCNVQGFNTSEAYNFIKENPDVLNEFPPTTYEEHYRRAIISEAFGEGLVVY